MTLMDKLGTALEKNAIGMFFYFSKAFATVD